ncbi:hypothetical protein [Marinobacter bryozoorum]|uniref:hypothetical protein n=1 Tax=Marinobacter bryozoorum TaxID=256324 RepID=UPI0020066403|nr:hypothetical protein [Marinobacter bryozoorum]
MKRERINIGEEKLRAPDTKNPDHWTGAVEEIGVLNSTNGVPKRSLHSELLHLIYSLQHFQALSTTTVKLLQLQQDPDHIPQTVSALGK